MDSAPPPNHKRKWLLISLTGLFLLIFLILFLFWLFIWRFEESTEDAYVGGNIVRLSSQVSAPIKSIYADNTDFVTEGKLLVSLDKTTLEAELEKSKANLGQTVRQVVQLFDMVSQQQANLNSAQAQLELARIEFDRRQALIKTNVISQEDYDTSFMRLEVAKANVILAHSQLESAKAQINETNLDGHPLVKQAKAAFYYSYLQLIYAEIFSPATGYIAHRSAQVGQWVKPGDPLLAIIPLNEIWVDANFKETQLADMRIGQAVEMYSDTYGSDVVYHGKLVGITPGVGTVFSILPPQNATGNWIKIVQRVPVKISLDPRELEKYPLYLGLSMHVKVHTKDQTGKRLSLIPPSKVIYSTNIYAHQAENVEAMMEEIVKANGS